MNWLFIVVALILVISVVRGAYRGFVRVVFSLVGLIIVLGLSIIVTPRVNTFLVENTSVYEKVEEACREKIKERAQENVSAQSGSLDALLGGIGIALPSGFAELAADSAGTAADGVLEAAGVYDKAASAIATAVVRGLAFLLSLIMVAILVAVIKRIFIMLANLPGLKTVNRVLGLLAGAAEGLIIVWIILYAIGIFSGFGVAGNLAVMIRQNAFLEWLYENNLLTNLLGVFL